MFGRGCSLTAVVADDLVDLYDDVLGDAGLFGSAIDHLCEVDALLVRLSDRHLTEYFIFTGNYDTDEITRNVCFPCCEFLQCYLQLSHKQSCTTNQKGEWKILI